MDELGVGVSSDGELSLKEVIVKIKEIYYYLISKWVMILITALIGGVLGLLYATSKEPIYTANCTFVLEDGDAGNSMLGSYSGIASMVGIDVGGGNGGIFHGENIFELYKSRLMIEKTLLSPVSNRNSEFLVDIYIKQNKLRERWRKNPAIANINFRIPRNLFTLSHDSILKIIVNDIKVNYLSVDKLDKKLSIINVKVKAPNEFFAKAFTETLVTNVNEFYVQTKTKKSLENVHILQRQADSVRRVLNASIGGTAAAIDANPNANPALQILRVPSQRRQIDVQATSAIYGEVVKNLELTKISLRKETPLIQVIDKPILPLNVERLGKTKAIILGGVIASIALIIFLILKKIVNDSLK